MQNGKRQGKDRETEEAESQEQSVAATGLLNDLWWLVTHHPTQTRWWPGVTAAGSFPCEMAVTACQLHGVTGLYLKHYQNEYQVYLGPQAEL